MAKHVAEGSSFPNPFSAKYRKTHMVLIGIALAAATQGLLPPDISTWVLMIVGVLTAFGVYQVPNKPQTLEVVTDSTKQPDIIVEAPEFFVNEASTPELDKHEDRPKG